MSRKIGIYAEDAATMRRQFDLLTSQYGANDIASKAISKCHIRLELFNGDQIKGATARDPSLIRGQKFDKIYLDKKLADKDETYVDNAKYAIRKNKHFPVKVPVEIF